MNKRTGIIVGAVIVLLLVGFAYFKMNKSSQVSQTPQTASANQNAEQENIKSLIAAGKNVSCQITYSDGSGSGAVYVSGKNMRGDFEITGSGKNVKSHMISDGTYTYSWDESTSNGVKFKVGENVTAQSTAPLGKEPVTSTGQDSLEKKADTKCEAWTVDASQFVVPTSVTFTDMSEMMQKLSPIPSPAAGSNSSVNSSVCAGVVGDEAKAACLKATSSQ